MIDPAFIAVLRQIVTELQDSTVNWVLTGSLSFALQGLPLEPHDIDIQTDEQGAYEIERRFASQVSRRVAFSAGERMRSHLGALLIDGIEVEIMGDIQKRLEDGSWESPVDLNSHRRFVNFEGMQVPVLSLEYEAQAYQKMGRLERAEMLRRAGGDRS
jgi:hypothetical protein